MRAGTKIALAALGAIVLAGAVQPIRWRLEIVALTAAGRIPGISWRELARLLRPGSGVWMGGLVATHDPYRSLTNPLSAPADIEAGRQLFRTQCAQCHGVEATGGSGPDLSSGHFHHGASDWALFRTITRGVPGTAMPGHGLAPTPVWQVVAFIRDVATKANERRLDSSATANMVGGGGIPAVNVTFDQLAAASRDSSEWLTYSGTYDGQRHSRLAQVTRANVGRLHLKWLYQFPKYVMFVEVTPLVVGNVMFVTMPPNDVWALDAGTGAELWSYTGTQPTNLRISGRGGAVHRGLAILGSTLYLGTSDAHLVALDARTGKLLWDVQVADNKDGYSMTSAPLALRDRIIVGVAGGEFAIRGFLDAYSPTTGKRLWRFNTVPAPGEPGSESWPAGDSWKQGGAPTWLTGSYDPALDLIYWEVGNPAPDFRGDALSGSNLYSNSVIALEAATGRLRWYYQFTPHDEHDWDAAQRPVLADAMFRGQPRKLMYWANRNGFYYVLDRVTGQFLHAQAFVKQTWASGFDSAGRPIEIPGSRPTLEGTLTFPSMVGATNWWSPSYAAASGLMFVPSMEGPGLFFKSDQLIDSNDQFNASRTENVVSEPVWTAVRALDASSGDLRWEYRFPPRSGSYVVGGLLSTQGELVFGGDQRRFVALDARAGHELWHFNVGGDIAAAPITYLSEGKQFVTLAAGRTILTFSLDGR